MEMARRLDLMVVLISLVTCSMPSMSTFVDDAQGLKMETGVNGSLHYGQHSEQINNVPKYNK
jgi:hypothetical protein